MWPIKEIFKSEPVKHMAVVNAFIEPILQEALRKNEAHAKTNVQFHDKENQEEETLLDHLVKQTSGTHGSLQSICALYLTACTL